MLVVGWPHARPTSAAPLPCRCVQGTLFVLAKDVPPKQRLLDVLAQRRSRDDAEVQRLAEEVVAGGGGEAAPAASPLAGGTWRLVWMQQGETANPLQKALASQVHSGLHLRPPASAAFCCLSVCLCSGGQRQRQLCRDCNLHCSSSWHAHCSRPAP